jgi:hypothetical protein
MGKDVTLRLTQDEAVVLYEWVARFNSHDYQFDDQAEQRALWNLEASLEALLPEPLDPRYEEILADARSRLRDATASPPESRHLTSESLAELILDALVQAGLLPREEFRRATEIAVEEINVRKALGDY